MIEIGNTTNSSTVSGIIFPGYMLGPINKKGCFYIGGGPCFNFGEPTDDIEVSINPYIEFHMGENQNLVTYDRRMGYPGAPYYYTLIYKTLTFNVSCTIQMNFFAKPK
ncbi:MAG: hypothetical protein WCL00_09730 [Bacteroidota bacterium]